VLGERILKCGLLGQREEVAAGLGRRGHHALRSFDVVGFKQTAEGDKRYGSAL
jgi:hypothetical protein